MKVRPPPARQKISNKCIDSGRGTKEKHAHLEAPFGSAGRVI